MLIWCVPLPSATSPGQCMSSAQSRPSRFVSLKFPSSMWPHITVSQCPWVVFAPNWHGQPQAQLQFVNSVPRIIHRSATGFSPFLACSELSLRLQKRPIEANDLAVFQPQPAGAEVLREMCTGAGSRDEQHVGGQGQQPRECDLWRGGIVTGGDGGDGRVGQDRLAVGSRKTQRAERHEGDIAYRALVDNGQAVAVGEVEKVLHADDFGNLQGPQEMAAGDITDPDPTDQSLVSRPHQHAELVNETRV